MVPYEHSKNEGGCQLGSMRVVWLYQPPGIRSTIALMNSRRLSVMVQKFTLTDSIPGGS